MSCHPQLRSRLHVRLSCGLFQLFNQREQTTFYFFRSHYPLGRPFQSLLISTTTFTKANVVISLLPHNAGEHCDDPRLHRRLTLFHSKNSLPSFSAFRQSTSLSILFSFPLHRQKTSKSIMGNSPWHRTSCWQRGPGGYPPILSGTTAHS